MSVLKFGLPKQEVYRKKEISEIFKVSIGTINNRIKDGTFTKIVPAGSRLVYIKCKEVDTYFKGESTTNTKTFSRSVTAESRQLVKLLPRVQREPIEKLLERIEHIEKSVGVDSIAEEIGIKKKKKSVRKKTKSVSTYYPKTTGYTSKRYRSFDNYTNDNHPRGESRGRGKGGLLTNKSDGNSQKEKYNKQKKFETKQKNKRGNI